MGAKFFYNILVFLLGVLPDSVFSLPGTAGFPLVAGYHNSLSIDTFSLVQTLVFEVLSVHLSTKVRFFLFSNAIPGY